MTAPGPMSPAYRLVTIALVLQTTMIAFEAMAVTTAMPRAAEELSAVGSYGLAFSSMMTAMLLGIVLAGIWTDRAGPLPGLYAGLILFAAGAVACAAAATWLWLLGGRLVAGLGAGIVIVAEFVAIGRAYPAQLRPRVFTWISAAWVVPSVVGAPVAGWLTGAFSWRAVFWVVLAPAALAATLLVLRRAAIGGAGRIEHGTSDRVEHLRVARLGAVVAVSAGLVQLAIHDGQVAMTPTVGVLAATGLLGLAWSVPRLLPPGTLSADRGLPAVIASRGLFNASFMSMVTFLPLMLVQLWGLSFTAAGMVVAAASLGWSAGSWIQGRYSGGVAARVRLVVIGAGVLSVAMVAITAATALRAPRVGVRRRRCRRRARDGHRVDDPVGPRPRPHRLAIPRPGLGCAAVERRPWLSDWHRCVDSSLRGTAGAGRHDGICEHSRDARRPCGNRSRGRSSLSAGGSADPREHLTVREPDPRPASAPPHLRLRRELRRDRPEEPEGVCREPHCRREPRVLRRACPIPAV
ncbi:MAG: MFS transporter [Dermatophilaceae bacterium]